MKNKDLFSIKKTEKDYLIGFVDSITNVKGGKAKILSPFKEDRSKLEFIDDFLILENGRKFSEKIDENTFITNRCCGITFIPSSRKYFAIKQELFKNFQEIFEYYCNKAKTYTPDLFCVKQLKVNGFQKIFLYELDSDDFTMLHFPRYIQSVKLAKEHIDKHFKDEVRAHKVYKIKNGVKTEI